MPRGILKVSSSGSSMVTTRNLRRSSPRKRRRVTFGEEPLVFCGAPTKKPVFFPASPTSMLASRIRSGKVSEIVKVLSHVTFPLRKKKLFFFFPLDAQRLPQRKKKKKKKPSSSSSSSSPSKTPSHFVNVLELLSGFFLSPWGTLGAAAAKERDVLPLSGGAGGKKRARQAAGTAVEVSASSSVSPSPPPPPSPARGAHHPSLSFSGFRSVLASAVLLANATSCTCCCEMP